MASEQLRNPAIGDQKKEDYVDDVLEEVDERKAAVLRAGGAGQGNDVTIESELLIKVFNFDPDVPPPPLSQFSYQERAARLREKVSRCCREVYRMPALAHELVMANVPQRFDLVNGPPKGCVEIALTVTKARLNQPSIILTTWTVDVNADPEVTTGPRPQRGHYGYTVHATSTAKTTGHIWFPDTKQPLNYRPWNAKKGEMVAIGQQTRQDRQYIFKLTGVQFNQYK